MRVLLLSAYDSLSHRYWRENLVAQFPAYDWKVLALPPRHFNFRVRTNPISWLLAEADTLSQHYDLVIATSLVDVATLRGLFANLACAPLWLYCHENQFAYPDSPHSESVEQPRSQLEAQMVFLYGCLCADHISFNSHWNKRSALQGLGQLIKRLPEKWNDSLLKAIENKSAVLPVPIQPGPVARQDASPAQDASWQLVWNHRWEYDKGPQHLLAFAQAVQASDLNCTLHVLGQQFRQQPESFLELERMLDASQADSGMRKGHWGFIESRDQYQALLASCDIVLSTAAHDFQGIAVLEAVQAGCLPLLPDRLVYPEQFDTKYLYRWQPEPQRNASAMLATLMHWHTEGRPAQPSVAQFDWRELRSSYQQTMTRLVAPAAH